MFTEGDWNMEKLLIDSWKNDSRIKEKFNEISNDQEYKYVNILEFCKIKYDINVTDLGRLFDVERQTIYNYYKLKTHDLSDLILDTICRVYGLKSIEQVIEKELSLFLEVGNSVRIKAIELKEQVKKSFNAILENAKNIYSYYINNPITPVISSLLKNNDMRYLGRALEIMGETNINSVQFLAYLMDYNNYIADQRNPKNKLYERIDSIIKVENQGVSIDYSDFEPINKVHLVYSGEVNDSKEFELHVPEQLTINDLIVNLTSNATITLFDIEVILTSIRRVVGNDVEILYGHITDNSREKILIDVFAHEK